MGHTWVLFFRKLTPCLRAPRTKQCLVHRAICVLETSYRTIVENFECLLSQPLGQAN